MKSSFIAVLLFVSLSVTASAQPLKIGHFDLQRLVSLSDAGKQAREQHEAKTRNYQEDINNRTSQLNKLKEELEKSGSGMKQGTAPSAELLAKDKEYGAQARELQRMLGAYQEELKLLDAELTRKVIEEFMPVLHEYAKKQGYDYILRLPEAALFAAEKHDLTDALIKEFNRKRKN
jgi:outer membrane protein